MARVLIDLRHLLPAPTGIGTYLAGLVRAMLERRDRPGLAFLCNHRVQTELVDGQAGTEVVHFPYPTYGMSEQAGMVRVIRRLRPEVVHFPHLGHPVGPIGTARLVLTIYDLIPEAFPEFYSASARWYRRALLFSACRRARWVTTISAFSKEDIARRLGYERDRITIVLPGRPEDGPRWLGSARSEGLLYVGNLKPHKDVPVLIEAFRLLRDRGLRIPLQLTGTLESMRRFNPHVGQVPPGVEFLGEVSGAELERLLAASRLLVLPSRYEGFGLPLLEAMSAGVPTVAAATSSLMEVGAEATAYFEPGSASALAEKIEMLYRDGAALEHYSRLGRERAALFDWQESANRMLAVYERLMGASPMAAV
ncbi:MAG TPA: glycosyltransferase family 1 protein [Thermoanaerobaculia bacterium]|nr:glycosyltransferase family 1 protein [Thermoanaerobaculia bacterium]